VATERLSRLDDGRLLYRLRHRWRDGTTHVVFEPGELVEKLAALVPPPRFHLVRYHGILGPAAGRRPHVVPGDPGQALPEGSGGRRVAEGSSHETRGESVRQEPQSIRGALPHSHEPPNASPLAGVMTPIEAGGSDSPDDTPGRARRLAWADLLRRVFAVDVLECPRCGGRMRPLATIHPPEATRAILECLGLPARAPPVTPAQPAHALADVGAFAVDFEAGA
jgi:hypothetical protein